MLITDGLQKLKSKGRDGNFAVGKTQNFRPEIFPPAATFKSVAFG